MAGGRRRGRQQVFRFRSWGGARRGAGRKPKGKRAGVPHTRRAPVCRRHPLHVTLRVVPAVARLRRGKRYRCVRQALVACGKKPNFRVCQYSVQGNHIHLVCEAHDRRALSRGIQGLKVSVAHRINELLDRDGTVFSDRYHDRPLDSPRTVKNALRYVLLNARHHGEHQRERRDWIDPCSSAYFFDGWRDRPPGRAPPAEMPIASPKTWLLRTGWRRHGLIGVNERPGPA
jgi:REP element-mobilizing transposase RayT